MSQWLWIVSAGVSDVQLVLKDRNGHYTRMECRNTERCTVRDQHRDLFSLATSGCLIYPDHHVAESQRGQAMPDGVVFSQDRQGAIVGWHLVQAEGLGYVLPDTDPGKLQVVCPKVRDLPSILQLNLAELGLLRSDGRILVLHSHRAEDLRDAQREPIAAGPIVAQFLAQNLGMTWEAGPPDNPNHSGWIDVLKGSETLENNEADILSRINSALNGIARSSSGPVHCFVTATGGFSKLKPLFSIIAARRFGRERVFILEHPERGAPFLERMGTGQFEHQALRLQAVEQIDRGNWRAAYGVASAALVTQPNAKWAISLRILVAPLLDLTLPEERVTISFTPLAHLALKVEAAFIENNVAQAIVLLGAFTETLIRTKVHPLLIDSGFFTYSTNAETYALKAEKSSSDVEKRFPKMRRTDSTQGRTTYRPDVSRFTLSHWATLLGIPAIKNFVDKYVPIAKHRNYQAHVGVVDTGRVLNSLSCQKLVRLPKGSLEFGKMFLSTELFDELRKSVVELFEVDEFVKAMSECEDRLRGGLN